MTLKHPDRWALLVVVILVAPVVSAGLHSSTPDSPVSMLHRASEAATADNNHPRPGRILENQTETIQEKIANATGDAVNELDDKEAAGQRLETAPGPDNDGDGNTDYYYVHRVGQSDHVAGCFFIQSDFIWDNRTANADDTNLTFTPHPTGDRARSEVSMTAIFYHPTLHTSGCPDPDDEPVPTKLPERNITGHVFADLARPDPLDVSEGNASRISLYDEADQEMVRFTMFTRARGNNPGPHVVVEAFALGQAEDCVPQSDENLLEECSDVAGASVDIFPLKLDFTEIHVVSGSKPIMHDLDDDTDPLWKELVAAGTAGPANPLNSTSVADDVDGDGCVNAEDQAPRNPREGCLQVRDAWLQQAGMNLSAGQRVSGEVSINSNISWAAIDPGRYAFTLWEAAVSNEGEVSKEREVGNASSSSCPMPPALDASGETVEKISVTWNTTSCTSVDETDLLVVEVTAVSSTGEVRTSNLTDTLKLINYPTPSLNVDAVRDANGFTEKPNHIAGAVEVEFTVTPARPPADIWYQVSIGTDTDCTVSQGPLQAVDASTTVTEVISRTEMVDCFSGQNGDVSVTVNATERASDIARGNASGTKIDLFHNQNATIRTLEVRQSDAKTGTFLGEAAAEGTGTVYNVTAVIHDPDGGCGADGAPKHVVAHIVDDETGEPVDGSPFPMVALNDANADTDCRNGLNFEPDYGDDEGSAEDGDPPGVEWAVELDFQELGFEERQRYNVTVELRDHHDSMRDGRLLSDRAEEPFERFFHNITRDISGIAYGAVENQQDTADSAINDAVKEASSRLGLDNLYEAFCEQATSCDPQDDWDRDGFSDQEERNQGTDPYNPYSNPIDADGDLIPVRVERGGTAVLRADVWEVRWVNATGSDCKKGEHAYEDCEARINWLPGGEKQIDVQFLGEGSILKLTGFDGGVRLTSQVGCEGVVDPSDINDALELPCPWTWTVSNAMLNITMPDGPDGDRVRVTANAEDHERGMLIELDAGALNRSESGAFLHLGLLGGRFAQNNKVVPDNVRHVQVPKSLDVRVHNSPLKVDVEGRSLYQHYHSANEMLQFSSKTSDDGSNSVPPRCDSDGDGSADAHGEPPIVWFRTDRDSSKETWTVCGEAAVFVAGEEIRQSFMVEDIPSPTISQRCGAFVDDDGKPLAWCDQDGDGEYDEGEGLTTVGHCTPRLAPQVCDPSLPTDRRLVDVQAGVDGDWVVLPPEVNSSQPFFWGISTQSPDLSDYEGNPAGTWTILYSPIPDPGRNFDKVPVEATIDTPDGTVTLEASTDKITDDPDGDRKYAPLIWTVNVHSEESAICAPGPTANCGTPDTGVDPSALLRTRVFTDHFPGGS